MIKNIRKMGRQVGYASVTVKSMRRRHRVSTISTPRNHQEIGTISKVLELCLRLATPRNQPRIFSQLKTFVAWTSCWRDVDVAWLELCEEWPLCATIVLNAFVNSMDWTHFSTTGTTHTHTHTHPFNGSFSGTTQVSRYQKGKTNLDFTEARDSEGSGISWAICKLAPCSRQTTTPAPHHSVFYRPDALPAAQPTVSKHWTGTT